jgi:hypothetical protein
MGRACSTNEAKINAYRVLVGRPEGRRLLGRPGMELNFDTCIQSLGSENLNRTHRS